MGNITVTERTKDNFLNVALVVSVLLMVFTVRGAPAEEAVSQPTNSERNFVTVQAMAMQEPQKFETIEPIDMTNSEGASSATAQFNRAGQSIASNGFAPQNPQASQQTTVQSPSAQTDDSGQHSLLSSVSDTVQKTKKRLF